MRFSFNAFYIGMYLSHQRNVHENFAEKMLIQRTPYGFKETSAGHTETRTTEQYIYYHFWAISSLISSTHRNVHENFAEKMLFQKPLMISKKHPPSTQKHTQLNSIFTIIFGQYAISFLAFYAFISSTLRSIQHGMFVLYNIAYSASNISIPKALLCIKCLVLGVKMLKK